MRNDPDRIPPSLARLFRQWRLAAVADPHELMDQPGTYALLLNVPVRRIKVGALGSLPFPAGLYAYVGSAWGKSVTLGHRLARHGRRSKVRRWHIDYLTSARTVTIIGAYWTSEATMTETSLAMRCAERFPSIRRFGNSDLRGAAPGHLFFIAPNR